MLRPRGYGPAFTSSLFRDFVCVSAITENPDSHKQDVGNGSKVLYALMARSGILARPSSKTVVESLYEKYIQATIICNVQQFLLLSYR